jgi:hypothetical protein
MHSASASDCTLWSGAIGKRNGYGMVKWKGRVQTAHRAVYEFVHNVTLPKGVDVCHTCDVRHCVNPDHLFIGTRSDNMRDCVAKGRLNNHNTRKTHCPQGHEYSGENVYMHNGRRHCWACKRAGG